MSKLHSLISRAPKRFTAVVAMIAAAIIVPAAVLAWGPNRPTFTFEEPAPYVTFNSITNNPDVGDERNFVRIKEDVAGSTYGDNVNLTPGKVYEVSVYYHNNAKTSLNASGVGIAHNTKLRMELPGVVKSGVNAALAGNISASNANPGTVYDEAYGKNATSGDIALRYVTGSAKVTSNGAVNGQTLPDTLFTTGANLGYDSLNGDLPGCNQFAGYVNFKFRVDQPDFTVKKEVSTDGKTWVKTATAEAGSTLQYRLTYQNTGTTQQDNVSLRDMLPAGVTYQAGSSLIANSTTGGQYKATIDGITTTGYNAGSYQPKGNAFFKFSAKLPAKDALKCGDNIFKNVFRTTTSAGYKEDDATVTVKKTCEPTKIVVCELATKKIVTINESDFNPAKYSKNLKDCETPDKIVVCELATKKIVTINAKDFDTKKYSKDLDDCKTPEKITVCEIATKQIVTIDKSQFNETKYTTDLSKCSETPVTPPELPQTGAGDNILAALGLGSIVAGVAYYIASRRALGL
ncbi:MAG: LPXTG cell wall anchor domain-containing protein [Patescibacteria group bacterium]